MLAGRTVHVVDAVVWDANGNEVGRRSYAYQNPREGQKPMWKPDICIYHGNCDDGFGAAWAIRQRYGDVDVAYVPGFYGKPLPDVTGKNVLFVDFSAKLPEIEAMAKVAQSIFIIDHHKTAEEDLTPFNIELGGIASICPEDLGGAFEDCDAVGRPPVLAWFDMNQSGATMAWKFANNDQPPLSLRLIEDRDLWRFKHGEQTKQFSAALRTYPMTFEVWDDILRNPKAVIDEGAGILRAHNANVEKFVAEAYLDMISGHLVPMVNVPYHYASDTANALLQKFPEAPFAACWFRRGDGMVQWSLRSEDSRIDVSEVAKQHGGGGHRNAAGFQSGMPA
jgi:hypothetical protein